MIVREVVVRNHCTCCGNIWYGQYEADDKMVCSACGRDEQGKDTWDKEKWELTVPRCYRPKIFDSFRQMESFE